MQFVYPQILWALLALLIPIIIHLFHFRRFKKVYFTNVRLLKEIKEEKSTRNKLRNLLVLLSRLLALAFLIFAFAQPFISRGNEVKTGKNYVSLFIDNSQSMASTLDNIPLLDQAKKKAEEIINAYEATDQFQILTHDLSSAEQRWLNKENSLNALSQVQITSEVNKLANVYNRQLQTQPSDGNHIIYLISDFQRSIIDQPLVVDSLSEVNVIPINAIIENNLAIDSVWFESVVPALNQNNKLQVRIKNYGSEAREDVRLSLIQNGQTRPEGIVSIPAKGSIIDSINLLFTEGGWQNIEIRIDDYPVQFDDSYFINVNVKDQMNVLSISDNQLNVYLNAVFKGLNKFQLDYNRSSNIQYDQLSNKDLIIFDNVRTFSSGLMGALKTYLQNGGNVLLFPDRNAEIDSYNQIFNQLGANTMVGWTEEEKDVFRINTEEYIFANVFESISQNIKLPQSTGNFKFNSFSSRGGEFILKYRDGSDYLKKYKIGEGELFVCVSPLDINYNSLANNAEIFVPLIYKIALASNASQKLSFTIGVDNFAEVKNNASSDEIIYSITGPDAFIPGQTNRGAKTIINFNNMIDKSGHYELILDEEKQLGLAFNYDRTESDLDFYNTSELKDNLGDQINIIDNVVAADLGIIIKEKDKGVILWRWCLILALIFLGIETLLLRFWKV
ncbi:MAG: VWA domain-containing protein [Saprospiraceae bacterium]|nr:VWA domain-containing protein [Saprospiraceae bacterium]